MNKKILLLSFLFLFQFNTINCRSLLDEICNNRISLSLSALILCCISYQMWSTRESCDENQSSSADLSKTKKKFWYWKKNKTENSNNDLEKK